MKNFAYLLGIVIVALVVYAVDTTQKNNELERAVYARYSNDLTDASEKLTTLQQNGFAVLII